MARQKTNGSICMRTSPPGVVFRQEPAHRRQGVPSNAVRYHLKLLQACRDQNQA